MITNEVLEGYKMTKILHIPMVFFILLIIVSATTNAQTQIIINEFSQGDGGARHWIELVVTADGTNIQGVFLDKDDDALSLILPISPFSTDIE